MSVMLLFLSEARNDRVSGCDCLLSYLVCGLRMITKDKEMFLRVVCVVSKGSYVVLSNLENGSTRSMV